MRRAPSHFVIPKSLRLVKFKSKTLHSSLSSLPFYLSKHTVSQYSRAMVSSISKNGKPIRIQIFKQYTQTPYQNSRTRLTRTDSLKQVKKDQFFYSPLISINKKPNQQIKRLFSLFSQ